MYLPQVWAEEWERRRSVGFQTRPQLARLMPKRAVESEVPHASGPKEPADGLKQCFLVDVGSGQAEP